VNSRTKAWWSALGGLGAQLIVGWLLIAAVLVGFGQLLTGPVRDEWPMTEEDEITASLAESRTSTWNTVTWWWSEVGDTGTIIVACGIVVVILRLVLHRWREALFVIAATVGQTAAFLTASNLIDRERPNVPQLDIAPPTSSFPSGHTSAALALYISLALVISWQVRRTWVAWLATTGLLLLPVIVAWARLYRGMHHPSDIAGSFINGMLCIALAWFLVKRRARLPEDDRPATEARPRGGRSTDMQVTA
jgi:membrane-associated phospholipid phosphatase